MNYQLRVEKLRKELADLGLDAVLVSSPHNIIYLTGYSNFSKEEREAFLLVTPEKQFIITDGRYSEAIKKNVPEFELLEISSEVPLKKLLTGLVEKLKLNNAGVEEDDLTHREYKSIRKIFWKLKHIEIKKHRSVKSREEIELIEKACQLGGEAFNFILKNIVPGVSEKQIAFELEKFIKENGATLSFEAIVAFSENSSVPHHQTGKRRLDEKDGQIVLLDFGARYKNYCSDMTRTVIFGKTSEKQKEVYKTVKEAQEKAVEYINKNAGKEIKAKDVDKVTRSYILKQGFQTIPHSLGHGIGVEVHEHPYLSPKSKEILKDGMVFSIEPGVYIPDFGGVRIEDLFVLEKNGLRELTKSSRELIEL